MAWTPYQIGLAVMMLITGSINTLATKWADTTTAVGIDGGEARNFNHPFLQAVGMFMGEMSCLLAFHILRIIHRYRNTSMDMGNQSFNPFIFFPAALLDMLGTSTIYVALNLTYASSFQMLRGAVMIFTALLSVTFLRRVIRRYMWVGMGIVIVGLVCVGIADVLFDTQAEITDRNGIITGDLLIVMAQVITACQMVYEEKFVTKHNVPPLQAVGWEGVFGFCTLGLLLIPFYFIKVGPPLTNDPENRLENSFDAFVQMGNNHLIIVATLGTIISIAFFNFSGISVTKELSATTRMVLDSMRTVVIWVVSLGVGWQSATNWKQLLLQAAGFILLVVGMFIYNNLVLTPLLRKWACCDVEDETSETGEREPLISENQPETKPAETKADIQNVDAATGQIQAGDYGTSRPRNLSGSPA